MDTPRHHLVAPPVATRGPAVQTWGGGGWANISLNSHSSKGGSGDFQAFWADMGSHPPSQILGARKAGTFFISDLRVRMVGSVCDYNTEHLPHLNYGWGCTCQLYV